VITGACRYGIDFGTDGYCDSEADQKHAHSMRWLARAGRGEDLERIPPPPHHNEAPAAPWTSRKRGQGWACQVRQLSGTSLEQAPQGPPTPPAACRACQAAQRCAPGQQAPAKIGTCGLMRCSMEPGRITSLFLIAEHAREPLQAKGGTGHFSSCLSCVRRMVAGLITSCDR
jgi:hypothetical protein